VTFGDLWQMNMTEPPVKTSNIERRLNVYIVGIFCVLFTLCLIGAIANSMNMSTSLLAEAWYLAPDHPAKTYLPGQPALAGMCVC